MWQTIQSAIDDVLARLSLKDLLRSETEMTTWAAGKTAALPTYGFPA